MTNRTGPLLVVATAATLVLVGCGTGEPAGQDVRPTPTATPSLSPSPSPVPSTPTPSPAVASPTPTAGTIPDHTAVHDGPWELRDVLVAAERAIRDPDTEPDDLQAWAWTQQAAYRQLAARAEWQEEVIERVPDDLREVARRNLRATVELRALTAPRDALPDDWRIVSPPPAEELLDHYQDAAAEFGIDWAYLAAIHLVESRMGRIRGDSVAGARGPMQFLPSTWEAYGRGDIEDYGDAIRAAAYYLADHGAPDDMDGAIWAYNHSDHYVRAIQDHAAVMREDERAYHAYYHWQVYYRLESGDVILPEGWTSGDGHP